MTLDGKVAIVTGASKGIGLAIARSLAQEGANVVLAARNSQRLGEIVKEFEMSGLKAIAVPTDMKTVSEIDTLVRTTVERHGRVDILVNNAGVGFFKPVSELSTAEFDEMWSVNMRGVFLATRATLPHMMKAGQGAIINIASLAGKNAFQGGSGYAATKWALRGFAGCLMLEAREYGIRVATIFPGSVDTGFSSRNLRGDGIPQPEDVASAVLFAVTAPDRAMFSEIDLRPTMPR